MASRYETIKSLWEQIDWDPTRPPHLQETEARRLDKELGESFSDYIRRWEEGLISSTELVDMIIVEAYREI